jgi:uridine phosphorylase
METLKKNNVIIDSLLIADHLGLLEARRKGLFPPSVSRAIIHGNPDRVHEHAKLLKDPKVVALKRGFVSYLGHYGGEPLIIASSGMGAGSAAIVFEELFEHGINKVIRVGTCGSYRDYIRPGDIVVPTDVLLESPVLRYIFPDYLRKRELGVEFDWLHVKEGFYFVKGFEKVINAIRESIEKALRELKDSTIKYHVGPIHDKDILHAWRERYSMNPEGLVKIKSKIRNLTIATDMESGALFTIAHMRNAIAGSMLVVVDFSAGEEIKRREKEGMEIAYKASLEAILAI